MLCSTRAHHQAIICMAAFYTTLFLWKQLFLLRHTPLSLYVCVCVCARFPRPYSIPAGHDRDSPSSCSKETQVTSICAELKRQLKIPTTLFSAGSSITAQLHIPDNADERPVWGVRRWSIVLASNQLQVHTHKPKHISLNYKKGL